MSLLISSSEVPSAASGSAPFPVRNRVFARMINGQVTNFVWNLYMDHLMLVITQIGTVGAVISGRQDATFDGHTTYSTNVVLGRRDQPGLDLCARQLVELLGRQGHTKPITLCLGLKDLSPATVREVVAAVREDHVGSAA